MRENYKPGYFEMALFSVAAVGMLSVGFKVGSSRQVSLILLLSIYLLLDGQNFS